MGMMGGQQMPGMGAPGPLSCPEFIQRWALHPESQSVLLSLDPLKQLQVMSEFRPRDTSRDVNALFIKFAQGIAEKGSGMNVLTAFLSKWQLNTESQSILMAMDPEMQAKVMREFAPRDLSRDCNALFLKFASGVAQGVSRGPAAMARSAPY